VLSVYNVFGCYGVSINGWMDGNIGKLPQQGPRKK